MQQFDILIVGAGHGGAQAAILLRQFGFPGTIGLLGAEPELPYERPPLSKDYLSGEKPFERMLIRPPSFWAERAVATVTATRINRIDPAASTAHAEDGRVFGFGRMIWAAGGAARRLSCGGADLAGVHVVRCRAEVDSIRAELGHCRRVVVVGGGYVGLEAAAVLRTLGKDVVLVEAADRVLARVAGAPISRFYETEHRARGVDVRLSQKVEAITGEGRAGGVLLATGESIAADMVIAGIGIEPSVGPLLTAGAGGGDGVHVDEYCRTTLPGIYAVGDCAAHPNVFAGGARIRLESVQNAHDQAATAVKHMLGAAEPYRALPWFWSNQYDLRLQTVGLSAGCGETVLRKSHDARSFSLIYLREGRVAALDCVNATKDYVAGRKLILSGKRFDPASLADAAKQLKELT